MLNLYVPRATTLKGSQPVLAGFSPDIQNASVHCFSTRMVELPSLLVATNA